MFKFNQLKGYLFAASAILIWGITFVNTRVLLEDFSALEINVLRFLIAWGVLWLMSVCSARTRATRLSLKDEALCAWMGLTGVFTYQFLENCAIYYTNASNVAILVSFGPIITAVMARILVKDKTLSARLIIGSLIAVLGVALVAFNGVIHFNLRPLGDLMAVCAMMSWGVYSILLDRANARGIQPEIAIRKSFGWAIVFMLPLIAWGMTETGFYAMDGSFSVTTDATANVERFVAVRNVLNILFLSILASALCFVLWSAACSILGVVRATIGLYITPLVGVVFAAIFLGERPTVMSALGGVLIIGGVATVNLTRKGTR